MIKAVLNAFVRLFSRKQQNDPWRPGINMFGGTDEDSGRSPDAFREAQDPRNLKNEPIEIGDAEAHFRHLSQISMMKFELSRDRLEKKLLLIDPTIRVSPKATVIGKPPIGTIN